MEEEEIRSSALKILGKSINYAVALIEGEKLQDVLGLVPHDNDHHHVMSADSVTHNISSVMMMEQSDTSPSADDTILAFRKLEKEGNINHSLLISVLTASVDKVGLGLLLRLMMESILPISFLLMEDMGAAYLHEVTLSSGQTESRHCFVRGIAALVLMEAFPTDKSLSDGQNVLSARKFLMHHVKEMLEGKSEDQFTMIHAINASTTSLEMVRMAHEYILSASISLPPVCTVTDFVKNQCNDELLPRSYLSLFSMLGEVEVLLETFYQVLNGQCQYNWISLFSCVKGNAHAESFKEHYCGFLTRLTEQAMFSQSRDELMTAIILSRQMEDDSYKRWFKDIVVGTNRSSNDKKHLHLLVETLNFLVPYESLSDLKIHLEVLSGFHDRVVYDHFTLIRTRISDLEHVIFKDDSEASRLLQESLKEFVNSNRISAKIIEASIFRSPFYVGCFLPKLLSAPMDKESSQYAFVQELYKQGKIPKKLFSTFNTLIPPDKEETLERDHRHIIGQVVESLSRGNGDLDRCIKTLEDALYSTDVEIREIFNLQSPGLFQWEIDFVDELVNCICKELAANNTYQVQEWVENLFNGIIAKLETVHWPLLVRLWELFSKQMTNLSSTHLRGLSCIFLHLAHSKVHLSKVVPITDNTTMQTFEQWACFLINSWAFCSQKDMITSLQFAVHYLQFYGNLKTSGFSISHSLLLTKIYFVHSRFTYSKNKYIENFDIISPFLSMDKLLFPQWLKWELNMDIQNDFLLSYERVTYLEMTLQSFLVRPTDNGGLSGDLYLAVKELFVSLVNPAVPSFMYGLSLLQGILNKSVSFWKVAPLPGAVEHAVSILPKTEHLYQGITNMLCNLPAKFLFRVVHDETLDGLELASSCLRSINALPKNDHFYILPTSLTFHVAKVLGGGFQKEFCSCSSIYHVSLLFALSRSTQDCVSIHNIPHHFVVTAQRLFNSSPSITFSSCDVPLDVYSVCMFLKLSDQEAENISHWLKKTSDSEAVGVFDCCLRELSRVLLVQHNRERVARLLRIAQVCVESKPWLISSAHVNSQYCRQQKEFLTNLRNNFPHEDIRLIPYVIFRILSAIPDDILIKICSSNISLAPVVISNHLQLMNLQQVSHLQSYSAFNIGFIGKCSEITQQFIHYAIPQELETASVNCHWTIKTLIDKKI